MNHPYSPLCTCAACNPQLNRQIEAGRLAAMQAGASVLAGLDKPMTGKEMLRSKISGLRGIVDLKKLEIERLEALLNSIPDKLVPEAEAGLLHVVRHLMIVVIALLCLCASPALADDTNAPVIPQSVPGGLSKNVNTNLGGGGEYQATIAPAVKSDFGASNVLVGFYAGTNGVELTSWLTADMTGQQDGKWAFTNAVLTSTHEPVVTKGTNGIWTISFPAEVKPTERITTAGEAAKVANQMFDQGAAFGALAKARNPDMDDVPTLVKVAGTLFQKQQQPK